MTEGSTSLDRGRRARWWIALLVFFLGLATGIAATGLAMGGGSDRASGPGETSAPSPTLAPPSVSPLDGSAGARVNAACLRVIEEARQISEVITGVGQAAADVDLQRLDDMVRALQPIEPALRRDLAACNVGTSTE